jgi:hypothetical protein
MLKNRLALYFIGTILLAGCGSDEKPGAQKLVTQKTYLNIDSLVSAQVKDLTTANARISKNASLDKMQARSEFNTDSLGWATELDIFRQLDVINKPSNKDVYRVVDGEKDVNSNLTVRSYQAKNEAPVRLLKLYYYENIKNLKKIEAVFGEKNTLYSTERSLTMGFDEIAGKNTLINYSIDGIQKMLLSDTVHFTIQCSIIFP